MRAWRREIGGDLGAVAGAPLASLSPEVERGANDRTERKKRDDDPRTDVELLPEVVASNAMVMTGWSVACPFKGRGLRAAFCQSIASASSEDVASDGCS